MLGYYNPREPWITIDGQRLHRFLDAEEIATHEKRRARNKRKAARRKARRSA